MNIFHMFNGWLNRNNKKLMCKILVGASALCWAICLSRIDMVFNNSRAVTSMQVIFRATHWSRRTSDLILFRGVACLKPRRWRSLPPMDRRLVTELMLDNFEFVLETGFLPFPFVVLYCVIRNNYIHSFM
jgi:hypothetical protein